MNLKHKTMRTLNMNLGIALLAIATLTVTSCKNTKSEKAESEAVETTQDKADHNEKQTKETAMKAEFKDATTANVFQHYIHVKTALVNSDTKEAQSGASMLGKALEENSDAAATAKSIAAEEDLEKQRELFSTLTTNMESVLRGALASGEIYKQYCPMAFNNTGGYWFSDSKEIRNPYFGDKMLKCGSVKETIK